MRERGFTLTELLIVIAVIMILLGLLFPIISIIKTQALRAKALSQLQQIRAACEHYKILNGAYPDSVNIQGVFLPGGPTGQNPPTAWSAMTTTKWQTVDTDLLTCLNSVNSEDFLPGSQLGQMLDPWKTLYRYRPNQYYPYNNGQSGAVPPIDGVPPWNADSVQLWSCGPNQRDDAGQTGALTGITPVPPTPGDDIFLKSN